MLRNWRENGRFAEDNSRKGNGRYSLKIVGNHQRQNQPNLWASLRAKGVGNCCSERQRDLTTLPPDAGAMPRTATYLVDGIGSGQLRQRR